MQLLELPVGSAASPGAFCCCESFVVLGDCPGGLNKYGSRSSSSFRHSRVRRKAPAMAPAAHMLMSPYRALRRAIS